MRHLKGKDTQLHQGIGSSERISILVGRHVQQGSSQTHTVSIIELAPGTASDPHYHKEREESYYFLEGQVTGIILLLPMKKRF